MTKKSNAKKSKQSQTKIPGTERTDAIPDIQQQAEKLRGLCEERMDLENKEREERAKLRDLLKEHKKTEYIYEDDDGERRRAFLKTSKEATASVQKLKSPRAAEE